MGIQLFPWKWMEHNFLGPHEIGRVAGWSNTIDEGPRVHLVNDEHALRVPLARVTGFVRFVALVACAKSKRPYTIQARKLYSLSTLFRAASAWAEAHADLWLILSARHGLVVPGQVLEPYEQSLHELTEQGRREWSWRVFAQLRTGLELGQQPAAYWDVPVRTALVLLAGRTYIRYLVPDLEAAGYQVITPLAGLGYGQQVHWLQNSVQAFRREA